MTARDEAVGYALPFLEFLRKYVGLESRKNSGRRVNFFNFLKILALGFRSYANFFLASRVKSIVSLKLRAWTAC
jgi:hypothetical protein